MARVSQPTSVGEEVDDRAGSAPLQQQHGGGIWIRGRVEILGLEHGNILEAPERRERESKGGVREIELDARARLGVLQPPGALVHLRKRDVEHAVRRGVGPELAANREGVGLAALADLTRPKAVEHPRQLHGDVFEGTDHPHRLDHACRPDGDAPLLQRWEDVVEPFIERVDYVL